MYLTYTEYTQMGGTLDSTAFSDYEYEAETIINWYTFNRLVNNPITPVPEAVKRCMMRLIELAKLEADLYASMFGSSGTNGDLMIASQSNDGVSISYNTISASEAFAAVTSKAKGNIIEETVRRYLNGLKDAKGRNLLYRGLYEDE